MFKKMLLCLMCLALLLPAAHGEEIPTLRIGAGYLQERYAAYPGATLEITGEEMDMEGLATAFATQSDQVDVYMFWAPSGLYSVKRHGYYAPLEGSEALMAKLDDLYPAFREALMTDDGHLAAWVMGADIMGMVVYEDVLDEIGLAMPETFSELLDTCEALADSDEVPSYLTLLGDASYSQQGVLDLYMDQYIRASQQQGGIVDFTLPEFAAMAERIHSTLPAKAAPMTEEQMDMGMGVFSIPVGFSDISKDMKAVPQAVSTKAGVVESSMTVAVVNPYSPNREAAIAFLAWCAAQTDPGSYIYDASLTEPMKDSWLLQEIERTKEGVAELEALEDMTAEQRDELDNLRAQLASLENAWTVSPESIAVYARLSPGLSVNVASPVTYDDALRTAAQRFLNGAFDTAGFVKECQDHIDMIYGENGVPRN